MSVQWRIVFLPSTVKSPEKNLHVYTQYLTIALRTIVGIAYRPAPGIDTCMAGANSRAW